MTPSKGEALRVGDEGQVPTNTAPIVGRAVREEPVRDLRHSHAESRSGATDRLLSSRPLGSVASIRPSEAA
jgi:hypothetical protein